MILDKSLLLSDSVSPTVSAASTNYIDTLVAGPEAYVGALMFANIEAAVTASGSATVTFDLQHDSDSAFGTATTLVSSGAIGKASLVAGKVVSLRLPPGTTKRYIRGYVTIATGPLTAGTFSMGIAKDVDVSLA